MTTAKGGRPKINIDYELVVKLARIHCTQKEIASVLGLSYRTLQRDKKFNELYGRELDNARVSLRRLQWDKAEGRDVEFATDPDGRLLFDDKNKPIIKTPGCPPDTTMQIFLGKQYLDQKDKSEIAGKDGGPLVKETKVYVVSDAAKKLTEEILSGKGTA